MISDRLIVMLAVGALLCVPAAAGVTESAPAESVRGLYREKVHASASGVYELRGWCFFHDRAKLAGEGMFAELKARGKAMGRVRKALFARLDEMCRKHPNEPSAAYADLRARAARNGSPQTAVVRSVDGLPSRVLCQETDGGEYVYDLAVKKADLEAEAAKGKFENRPQTIETHWRNVVREQLYGKNRMAFIRDCGALDLWTLESAKTCGVKELRATNGNEVACCRRCLNDLAKSAARAKIPAAEEYAKLADGLYEKLAAEMAAAPELATNLVARTMILSFGCCAQSPEKERGEDLDVAVDYVEQTENATNTVSVLARLISHTPGSELYWRAMGVAAQRAGLSHVALACHRNVLRMKPNDAESLFGLAEAYDALGLHLLAHGAALLAFAENSDMGQVDRIRKILERK